MTNMRPPGYMVLDAAADDFADWTRRFAAARCVSPTRRRPEAIERNMSSNMWDSSQPHLPA